MLLMRLLWLMLLAVFEGKDGKFEFIFVLYFIF